MRKIRNKLRGFKPEERGAPATRLKAENREYCVTLDKLGWPTPTQRPHTHSHTLGKTHLPKNTEPPGDIKWSEPLGETKARTVQSLPRPAPTKGKEPRWRSCVEQRAKLSTLKGESPDVVLSSEAVFDA